LTAPIPTDAQLAASGCGRMALTNLQEAAPPQKGPAPIKAGLFSLSATREGSYKHYAAAGGITL